MSKQTPAQELVAKDLHGQEWRFKHIFRGIGLILFSLICLWPTKVTVLFVTQNIVNSLFCHIIELEKKRRSCVLQIHVFVEFWLTGQPRRHLLTTGWSTFVASKKLASGDALILMRLMLLRKKAVFLPLFWSAYAWDFESLLCRGENDELRVGVRRLVHRQNTMPSSVISSHSMHVGVLATASHAISTHSLFTVYYKPRLGLVLGVRKHIYSVALLCILNMIDSCCHEWYINQD